MNWFRKLFPRRANPEVVPAAPSVGVPTEIAESIWRDGHVHGLAVGELRGRNAAISEMESILLSRHQLNGEFRTCTT